MKAISCGCLKGIKMRKYQFLPIMLLVCGCICLEKKDQAADDAAEKYRKAFRNADFSSISLDDALKKQICGGKLALRREFAGLHFAKLSKNPAMAEQKRIRINLMLQLAPDTQVKYNTAGAFDCPEEIPHAGAAEKAALIIDNGESDVAELISKVRDAHINAVVKMNDANDTPNARTKYEYLAACLDLCEKIGIDLTELCDLEKYENRFDSAMYRWEKSRKNGK